MSDPVLDAVRAEVTAYGIRRATMTSVASRAGISRATLYRRATSLDQLVNDALVADFDAMLKRAFTQASGSGHAGAITRTTIVEASHGMLSALADNAFTRALLDHDPELLLPYIVDRLGRSQETALAALEGAIRSAQIGGTVRHGDPRIVAIGSLQALTPYVISLRLLEAVASREVWFAEAVHLLDSYLRPIPNDESLFREGNHASADALKNEEIT